jgi:hypothetical protein
MKQDSSQRKHFLHPQFCFTKVMGLGKEGLFKHGFESNLKTITNT